MLYTLDFEASEKVSGTYPQLIFRHDVFENGNEPVNVHSNKSIPKDLIIEDYVLDPKAKITDILSINTIQMKGCALSKKAVDILNEFNNKYLNFNKLIIPSLTSCYYYLNTLDADDLIDYKASIFVDWLNNESEISHINSFEDFIRHHKEQITFPQPKYLKISKKLDIIKTPYDIYTVISEKVKDRILESGLTGFEITPYDHIEIDM
ncbi:MAG: hypothetical protein N4A49_09600 [Marinifilaceae bacterium]|jgi:hypothetical protein|nr:hypothetical protein [Marinifilaceae bacterium]